MIEMETDTERWAKTDARIKKEKDTWKFLLTH